MQQLLPQRTSAYRVCVLCGRRDYRMVVSAPDAVHGLCGACIAHVAATTPDVLGYLQDRLPRTQPLEPMINSLTSQGRRGEEE